MTTKKPSPKRKPRSRNGKKAAPKPKLSPTDRMRAAGLTGKWRWHRERCVCGSRLATNGKVAWCPTHLWWD